MTTEALKALPLYEDRVALKAIQAERQAKIDEIEAAYQEATAAADNARDEAYSALDRDHSEMLDRLVGALRYDSVDDAKRCAVSGLIILDNDECLVDENTNEHVLRAAIGLPALDVDAEDAGEEAEAEGERDSEAA